MPSGKVWNYNTSTNEWEIIDQSTVTMDVRMLFAIVVCY